MSELKPLVCPKCGGHISRKSLTCNFCGIQFLLEDDNVLKINFIKPGMTTLGATVFMAQEEVDAFGCEETTEIAIKELSRKLAQSIAPYMTVRTTYDPYMRQQKVQGLIRVIKPNTSFGDIGFDD